MNTRVWADIDLGAIGRNARGLRRITNPGARLMAVVKADAYGHGADEVSKIALENGADILGVARIEEAVSLRKAGYEVPILVFGYTPSNLAKEIIDNELIQTVHSQDDAKALARAAANQGVKIQVHLKTDTGMGRLGMPLDFCRSNQDAVDEALAIARLRDLDLKGVFTHFASADSADKTYADLQLERFIDFLNRLKSKGLEISVKHAANSAAIIEMPESHFDMVRAGISLYGLYPSDEVDRTRITLSPAMSLKSRIVYLKNVPKGFKVSYGSTWEAKEETVIATIPIGYADGFNRLLSSKGHMLVRGRRAPIAGRVCMDLTMLDVGHIPDVALNDEVVAMGRQGNGKISADEIASNLETINYEVVSTVTRRVQKRYFSS